MVDVVLNHRTAAKISPEHGPVEPLQHMHIIVLLNGVLELVSHTKVKHAGRSPAIPDPSCQQVLVRVKVLAHRVEGGRRRPRLKGT